MVTYNIFLIDIIYFKNNFFCKLQELPLEINSDVQYIHRVVDILAEDIADEYINENPESQYYEVLLYSLK